MKALIVVDIQNDFLPGGPLEIEEGDAIVPVVNKIQERYDLVAATQDWHPPNHLSFASNHPGKHPFDVIDLYGIEQTLWPDHCVWNSPGAEFAEDLNMDRVTAIFRKGMDPHIDSYSGFFDNGRKHATGLAHWLHGLGVTEVHLAGLAAEICVAFTAEDAAESGFKTALIEDATRPLSWNNYTQKRTAMQQRGIRFIQGLTTGYTD